MPKNFFKSDTERNLWIKLNAERIRYSNKVANRIDEEDLGDIDKPFSPMWISNNQLEFDEHEREALRFSFEELLTLSQEELFRLSVERNKEKIKLLFDNFFNKL
jgi:hypothetical protein